MDDIAKEAQYYDYVTDIVFKLLCELDRVCKKYDIKYFLAYGTLLGAARENDVIKWDDDADVFITSSELDKLIFHKDEFGEDFELVVPGDYGESAYFNSVVHLNYTKVKVSKDVEESAFYNDLNTFFHVDLFHISPAPGGLRGLLYGIRMCMLFGMANAFRYKNDTSHYSPLMRIGDSVLRPIGKLIGLRRLRAMIDKGMRQNDGKDFDAIHDNGNDIAAMFRLFDRKCFEKAVLLDIRSHPFPSPVGYDQMLRQQYGNYFVPPSTEGKRWKFADASCLEAIIEQ